MSTKNVLVLGGNFAGLTPRSASSTSCRTAWTSPWCPSRTSFSSTRPSSGSRSAGARSTTWSFRWQDLHLHDVKFVHGEATTIDPTAQQVQTTQGCWGSTTW